MILTQGTPEWLEARKGKIGASDIPVVMGVSPYKTPYQLFLEKLDGQEQKDNYAMRFGRENERKALDLYEKETGLIVIDRVYFHPVHFWMMASCDGVDMDETIITEVKCHGEKVFEDVLFNDKVPDYDMPQLQAQIETSGINRVHYIAFFDGKIAYTEVTRDSSYISKMIPQAESFYKCMVSKTPPKLCERDYVRPKDEKKAYRLGEVKRAIKALESEAEILQKEIIQESDGNNIIFDDFKIFKSVNPGSVEYKKIPELKSVNLDNYRKPSYTKWSLKLE